MANRRKIRSDGSDAETVATLPAQQFPLGYQQITDLTAAVLLAPPPGATFAVIQAEGAPVRWRDDGVAPTAAIGMRLPQNSELRLDALLTTVRCIQEAAGAKLNISYYG
jgi:hypothetical protein